MTPAIVGVHEPRCNDGCDGDTHALLGVDLRPIRGLTSVGAVTLTVNGVAYIRQADLIAALDRAEHPGTRKTPQRRP